MPKQKKKSTAPKSSAKSKQSTRTGGNAKKETQKIEKAKRMIFNWRKKVILVLLKLVCGRSLPVLKELNTLEQNESINLCTTQKALEIKKKKMKPEKKEENLENEQT